MVNTMLIAGMAFVAFSLGSVLLFNASASGFTMFQQRTQAQMQVKLTSLFLFNDARRCSLVYLACLLLIPFGLFMANIGLFLTVLSFILLLLLPRIVFAVLDARRARRINESLPDSLAQVASAMRAGATFSVALQGLVEENDSPLGEELSLMLREHRMGARMDDALENLAERVRSEEMDLVVSAVLIAQDVGGNLAEILHRLADTVRRKLEMEGKIKALTSQGMLQGYVVSCLPFGLLAALSILEPESTLPMFNTLLGWIALAIMAVFQLTGTVFIRKIVTIEI